MTSSTGVLPSSFLPTVTDPNATDSIVGYAVTNAAASTGTNAGTWQYQVNGSGPWADLTSASDAAAIVLKSTDKVRWSGSTTTHTALSIVAIDSSGGALGASGSTVDASVKGGSSRFSTATTLAAGTGPVLLDLNGDGQIGTHQVLMDVNTDGQLDFAHWTGAQDGVLVWDKNGNGTVTHESQYTFSDFAGTTDMARLRSGFDSNGDGVLNAQDAKFAELRVWQDANENGVADAGELHTLAELGLNAIGLNSDNAFATPHEGLTVFGQTSATQADGASVAVFDAQLSYTDAWTSALALTQLIGAATASQKLDLSQDSAANVIALGLEQVKQAQHQAMVVKADAQDVVQLQDSGWTLDSANAVTVDGHSYDVWANAGAHLLIDHNAKVQPVL